MSDEVFEDSTFDLVMGVMGNVLEWYDFALFGFFSDIIADKFFAPQESEDALIKSFAVFGGAFLMRPIGGLTIGYIGDKHGRKAALSFSLLLMGIPTFLMGCLPSYEQIGGWATFFLIAARLLQGLSVGGQLPASLVYTVEKRPREHWGYYGAFVMMATEIGALVGNLVGAILRDTLTEDQLYDWGWRIPFLSGILIVVVGLYIRAQKEHHPNKGVYDHEDSIETNPIMASLRPENRIALIATILAPVIGAAGFYLTFVWMAIYMEDIVNPPVPHAFWVNAAALFFGLICIIPIGGYVSDKFGRNRVMATSAAAMAVLGPILIRVISDGQALPAFMAQWILGIVLAFFVGPECAWLVENFSPEVRLTSVSLGYDLAQALTSGFSPIWATMLAVKVDINSPGYLYPIFSFMSLIGLYIMYRRNDNKDVSNLSGREIESLPSTKLNPII